MSDDLLPHAHNATAFHCSNMNEHMILVGTRSRPESAAEGQATADEHLESQRLYIPS